MRFNGLTAIAIYLIVVASTVAGYWLATKERLAEWKRAVVNQALVAWYGYIIPAAEAVAKAYGDAGDETGVRQPAASNQQPVAKLTLGPIRRALCRLIGAQALIDRERAERQQLLDQHVELMRAIAMQLNHNTKTMKRWSTEHHELNVIEYRHYKKEKGGQNGAGKIISLDEAAGR